MPGTVCQIQEPRAKSTAVGLWILGDLGRSLRDDLVVIPATYTQYGARVSLPDGPWTHDGEIPDDDEAVSISRDQAIIMPDESCCMNLGPVSSEDGLWLQWCAFGCHSQVLGSPTGEQVSEQGTRRPKRC